MNVFTQEPMSDSSESENSSSKQLKKRSVKKKQNKNKKADSKTNNKNKINVNKNKNKNKQNQTKNNQQQKHDQKQNKNKKKNQNQNQNKNKNQKQNKNKNQNKIQKKTPNKQKKQPKKELNQVDKQILTHQEELELLKKEQPEFYKYMLENDQEALSFGHGLQFSSKEPESIQEQEQEQDKDKEIELEKNDTKEILGRKDIENFKTLLSGNLENIKPSHLKKILLAFQCGCRIEDFNTELFLEKEGSDDEPIEFPFIFENSKICSDFVVMVIKLLPNYFDHKLGFDPQKYSDTSKTRGKIAFNTTNWNKIKQFAVSFLSNLQFLLSKQENEQEQELMIKFILTKIDSRLVPYYLTSKLLSFSLSKTLIAFWGKIKDEQIKGRSYLIVRKIALGCPTNLYEKLIRRLHSEYKRHTLISKKNSYENLQFLMNCVVDFFGIDQVVSYSLVFIYIKELASLMRLTINAKKKESAKKICTWEFINELRLWINLLSSHGSGELQPLISPLCQITFGVLQYINSPVLLPMKFILIKNLNHLSRKTGVYTPVSEFLLNILDLPILKQKAKQMKDEKIYELYRTIHVTKEDAKSFLYQEKVVRESLKLLLEHLEINSYSISFPELVIPTIIHLKRFQKNSKIKRFNIQAQQLIEKMNKNSKFIKKQRQSIEFGPNDQTKIEEFLLNEKEKKSSPLTKFYLHLTNLENEKKKVLEKSKQLEMERTERKEKGITDKKEKNTLVRKRRRERAKIRRKESRNQAKQLKKMEKKKLQKQILDINELNEFKDIVEDMDLSD
ncbi:nucleolar complex protein 2 [Anaeramoeba flamelloides]|uniref:Nucleolar complex protein 2 n=1 Tax=Anaeramoeba flamelloides TaxID=1746091 RepID=A0AAV7YZY0_9EUKA|nr:nucleolar complex protein 2 [Anaeramoeba flamelloides]